MGIIHHSSYLPWLEEARVHFLDHEGHPYAEFRDGGIDFAVLEAFVQYRQPVRFHDVVEVHLAVGASNRVTFQLAYLLTVDGEVRTTAVTVHGAVDPEGRPVRLPPWIGELQS
jgi:acyl-CoA thioester hydrolase